MFGLKPPKYQKMLCNVAPQPKIRVVPSPYSKFKSSLILPKLESIFEINHEIFTVIINNEWLVIAFSTQNKYSVSS